MTVSAALMAGKRGLIMGVANDRSIAWGAAKILHEHGATLAFTYQDAFESRVRPLAASAGSDFLLPCDVTDQRSIDDAFEALRARWDGLDFVVHAIAYSDRDELKGKYLDTSRDNFIRTLDISCFSFTAVANAAAAMMGRGGSLVTLTYSGSQRVMPQYNVMGVAKAALEASVRYLAADLGGDGIRVNALSAGPMRTLAGSGISSARYIYKWSQENAPLRRSLTLAEVGAAALYLLSDLSSAVTGEVHHVDAGYHVVGMKATDTRPDAPERPAASERPAAAPERPAAAPPPSPHEKTRDQARRVYDEMVEQAQAAYDDVVLRARNAYEEVVEYASYGEAAKRARDVYDDLATQLRGSYDKALRQARDAGEAAVDHIRTIVGEPALAPDFQFTDRKPSYTFEELLKCAHGELFGPRNARLPLPPMLMFDRITRIADDGGKYGKGEVVAELDISPELWFFHPHFESDPVMPGCLGLDAMWQLIGFYLGWLGAPGRGRALGVGEVKFSGTVLPSGGMVRYHVSFRRVIQRKLVLGIADASMTVDGREIYEAKDLRVGLFTSTESF